MPKFNQYASYKQKSGVNVDILSTDELDAIHRATLTVMRHTGLIMYNDNALDVLEDGGCIVDRETQLVKFPEWVVEDAIKSAPPSILFAGRDKKHDTMLESNRVAFTNFGAGVEIYDPYTGELRHPTAKDVGDTALVVDALENVNVYSQAIVPRDCAEGEPEDLVSAERFLNNTTKHCHHIDLTSGESSRKFIEMASIIVGGMDELRARPIVSALICPTSPLQMSNHGCDVIMEFARAGIPVNVLSMALAGGTSPITLAGTLVTHSAEVLGGIVLAQLTNRGCPVLYGSSTTTFDMRNMTAPVGSPELGLINACVGILADYYNLPSYTAGT